MALSSVLASSSVCFIRFRCMFYLDVAKLDLVLHMLQCLYTYVASVCFECFSCFHMYIVSVLSVCCICCGGYTHVTSVCFLVSDVCCSKCFMLQVFSLADAGSGRMRSVFIWMLHVLQWLYTYFAKCMFQLLQAYVASILFGCCICCSGHIHILQANVSPVLEVCYRLYQVLHVASVIIRGKAKFSSLLTNTLSSREHRDQLAVHPGIFLIKEFELLNT
jgi:hypothetical protein